MTACDTAAIAADTMSSFGPVYLRRTDTDVRGVRRFKPQYSVSLSGVDGDTRPVTALDAAALGKAISAIDANELSVRWPRGRETELQKMLMVLADAGFQREDSWPAVAFPSLAGDELIVRSSRGIPQAAISGPFARAYAEERQRCTVNEAHRLLVSSLQAEIEAVADRVVLEFGFAARYRVQRIMNVGSTSRGTYAIFPADFDLVVHTEYERTSMEISEVNRACERLVGSVARSDAFERFWQAILLSADRQDLGPPSIELQSLGARGPQSLVARYDLVLPGVGRADRHGFLDVTFGKLPQIIGYEISIRRLFETLDPACAERLRAEIRVAKSILRSLGNVYGSANRGLRAHVVEQWIIQSFGYRSSGIPVGTLDNALRLVIEEVATAVSTCTVAPHSFKAFKERFPLWHPGWWEGDVGFQPGVRNVNLWDLLGDGDATEAEQKWRSLVALGSTFCQMQSDAETWKIEDLVDLARLTLGMIEAGQPILP